MEKYGKIFKYLNLNIFKYGIPKKNEIKHRFGGESASSFKIQTKCYESVNCHEVAKKNSG